MFVLVRDKCVLGSRSVPCRIYTVYCFSILFFPHFILFCPFFGSLLFFHLFSLVGYKCFRYCVFVVLLFVFCIVILLVFFISTFFSFIDMSRSFLSVIVGIKFDASSSSAVIVSKLLSFANYISLHQNSSGVSVSVCFVPKNSVRLWYIFFSERSFR